MTKYYVFTRSATNFTEFARARKMTIRSGLTYEEARDFCTEYNNNLSTSQKKRGTKAEFTRE